jgi:hypothetical protein
MAACKMKADGLRLMCLYLALELQAMVWKTCKQVGTGEKRKTFFGRKPQAVPHPPRDAVSAHPF